MRQLISSKASFYLALFLQAGFFFFLYFYFDTWIELDQIFFHLPLLAAAFVIVRGRIHLFQLFLLFCVAYILASFYVIDKTLYQFLIDLHLPPSRFITLILSNPQYIKLVLYVIVSLILLGQIIFKSLRTYDRFFIFLSCISSLAVTGIIHRPIIQKGLIVQLESENQKVGQFLDFIKSSNVSAKTLEDICVFQSYQCFSDHDLKALMQENTSQEHPEHFSRARSLAGSNQIPQKDVYSFGYFADDGTWRRRLEGLGQSVSAGFVLVAEEKRINFLQKHYEEMFSETGAFAHFVWGWLFIVIGMAHKSKWKNSFLKT